MLALAAEAQAFEPKTTDGGEIIRWHSPDDIVIEMAAPTHNIPGGVNNAVSAMEAAFSPWLAEIGAMAMGFVLIDNDDAVLSGKDKVNTVFWVYENWADRFDERALAMTVTTYRRSDGAVLDADIAINAERYEWTVAGLSCAGGFDLQNVMAHEVGHLIGLAHEAGVEEATMFPTSGACETKKRDLSDDDRDGAQFLYGESDIDGDHDGHDDDDDGETDTPAPPLAGCAATGGAGGAQGGLAALFVLASLALVSGGGGRRRRRARCALASLALVALAAPVADASTLRHVAVDQLAEDASLVVRGTVVAQRSRWHGDFIVTDSVVKVRECWTDAPCGNQVVVTQLGGEVGDVGMHVEGVAPLALGDGVVLFLRARRDGSLAPVGMAQGMFREVRDRAGRVELQRDLRPLSFAGGAPAARVEAFQPADLRGFVLRSRLRKRLK